MESQRVNASHMLVVRRPGSEQGHSLGTGCPQSRGAPVCLLTLLKSSDITQSWKSSHAHVEKFAGYHSIAFSFADLRQQVKMA